MVWRSLRSGGLGVAALSEIRCCRVETLENLDILKLDRDIQTFGKDDYLSPGDTV